MRAFLVWLGVGSIFLLSGCGKAQVKEGIILVLPEGGKLPKAIAGQWKAEDSGWSIQFDKNGYPVSATHPMTGILLLPGKTTTKPFAQVSGIEIYTCGNWTVTYREKSRELTIEIPILYATQDVPAIIEGTIDEVLKGTFNEDFTMWNANWQSSSDYDITEPVSGKTVRTKTLESEKDKGTLTFYKVTD
jgi:hypothetical protein